MKSLAIARVTYRQASQQPATVLLLLLFGAAILLSGELTMFTLDGSGDGSGDGADRAIRETGVASMVACGVLVALSSSSAGLWHELESCTAGAVLAAPIRREAFFLGKFFGLFALVAICTVLLGLLLLLVVWTGEGLSAMPDPSPSSFSAALLSDYLPRCGTFLANRGQVIAGAVGLVLIQLGMITALTITASLVCPIAVNAVICLGMFTLGHLSGTLGEISSGAPAWLRWPVELIRATVLPNFEALNASSSIAAGHAISSEVLVSALGYGVAWTIAVLLIGMAIFHQRELM